MKPGRTWKDLGDPGAAADFFETEKPLPPFIVSPAYSAGNALRLSELARLSYCDSPVQRRESLARANMRERVFYDKGGTQALLAEGDGYAVLALRGTSHIKDWLQDVRVFPVPYAKGGLIHKGFRDALEKIWSAVEKELIKLDCPVYAGGHSLGGALAVAAAGLFPFEAVYTFGCPPIGDAAFASLFKNTPIYRLVHGRDAVPKIPLAMSHVGQEINLTEIKFGLSWKSFFGPPRELRCHIPLLYSCALERLLQ